MVNEFYAGSQYLQGCADAAWLFTWSDLESTKSPASAWICEDISRKDLSVEGTRTKCQFVF